MVDLAVNVTKGGGGVSCSDPNNVLAQSNGLLQRKSYKWNRLWTLEMLPQDLKHGGLHLM